MKTKVIIKDFFKNNWIFILIWLGVAFFLMQFWSLKMAGLSNPISHVPSVVDGSFVPTIGEIREIVVDGEWDFTHFNLHMNIHDSQGNVVWTYDDDEFYTTRDARVLDTFEKEAPLLVNKGETYYVDVDYNGFFPLTVYIREYSGSFKKSYTVLSAIILFVLAASFVLYKSNLDIHYRYAILAFVLALSMGYVMPPFSASDEASHFIESYEMSSRLLGKPTVDEQELVLVRADDFDSITMFHDASTVSEWYATFNKGDTNTLVPLWAMRTVVTYAKYVYLPSMVGIIVSRVLGFSGHILLILGSLLNLLAVIAIVTFSIYIIPKGKVFIACLGLLPEVLFFANSFSYDGMNFALVILYVSYFAKLYYQEEKINVKQLILLVVFFILMVPIKYVYVWLGILILFLPPKKLTLSRKQIIGILSVIVLIGIGAVIVVFPQIYGMMTSENAESAGTVTIFAETGVSLGYVKDNFDTFKYTIFNTLFQEVGISKYPDSYMRESFGMVMGRTRYMDGADNYLISPWLSTLVVMILGVSLFDTDENEIHVVKRTILAACGFMSYFSIILAMYFVANVIGNVKVYGVDGRYILPIYSILPLVIKNKVFSLKIDAKKVCLMLMSLIALVFIFDAYYHYAYVYFAQPTV